MTHAVERSDRTIGRRRLLSLFEGQLQFFAHVVLNASVQRTPRNPNHSHDTPRKTHPYKKWLEFSMPPLDHDHVPERTSATQGAPDKALRVERSGY